MPLKLSFLIAVVSIFFSASFASAEKTDFEGRNVMNGFRLDDFPDFYAKWKLVTVRYREDTREMRFTYANEPAAKALEKNSGEYPDGAVFAKIGFISESDPSFQSSVVPSGAKRYQFMVRDRKKFAETDGWGYALFNGEGKTFAGNPIDASKACAACHRLVPERGYVFSQFVSYAGFVEKTAGRPTPVKPSPDQLSFQTRTRRTLPSGLQNLLPEKDPKVRFLTGPLQKHLFEGTVNEIGPFLADEARARGMPAVLVNDEGTLFAFSYLSSSPPCQSGKTKSVVSGRTIAANKSVKNELILKVSSHCPSPNN